jgi:monoamine oxidase
MTNSSDTIVIGAGASGLMVAQKLSQAGQKVIVLEALSRLGGRIHTIDDPAFAWPVELGAEFIHGNLPVTLGLLREAGIPYTESGGQFWNASGGELKQGFGFMQGWDILETRLKELKQDMSIDDFLDTYFKADEHTGLRNSVKGFAQGYDAADTSLASTFAFRNEWLNEDEQGQYRVDGGYDKLIHYMEDQCKKAGCEVLLSSVVREVRWRKDNVEVSAGDNTYTAQRLVITVPVGILQDRKKGIAFIPDIPAKLQAIDFIGFGNAMKVILQFRSAFWKEEDFIKRYGKKIKDLGFLTSDAPIPTWWTRAPNDNGMITGWFAGPKTAKLKDYSHEAVLQVALDSLAHIFKTDAAKLKAMLSAWKVIDWANEPFAKGAYTYATVAEQKVKDTLDEPIENTLYFAGEAFYKGPEMGTVEAALASGLNVAKEILAMENN